VSSGGSDSRRKQIGDMPMDHEKQNRQSRNVSSKYGLTKEQQRKMHMDSHNMGYGYDELEELAESISKSGKGGKPWRKRKKRR